MKYVLICFILLVNFSVFAYEKTQQIVRAHKVAGNSYYIAGRTGSATKYEGFISNAGFVITSEGVVVFDALGTPALSDAMIAQIKKLTQQPIVLVITSHYHADHIYGLQSFKKLGAEIWAPQGALEYFHSEAAKSLLEARKELLFPYMDDDVSLIKPDKIISQETHFRMGKTNFIIHYLAAVHSDGDMMLSVQQDGVLFSGDLIFSGRLPFVGSGDIKRWLSTLDILNKLSLRYLVPGHGKPSDDIKKISQITHHYLTFILEKLTHAVNDLLPFDEAYSQIDWSAFEDLPTFEEANRRNAYAVYLYLEQTLE